MRLHKECFTSTETAGAQEGWMLLSGELERRGADWLAPAAAYLVFNFPDGGAREVTVSLELEPGPQAAYFMVDLGNMRFRLQAATASHLLLQPSGQDMAYAYGLQLPRRVCAEFHAGSREYSADLGSHGRCVAENLFPGKDIIALTVTMPAGARFRNLTCAWQAVGSSRKAPPARRPFVFHNAVDFYDDLIYSAVPWSPATFDNLMACNAAQGVARIYWIYNGEDRHGYWENMAVNARRFPGLEEKVAETQRAVPHWLAEAARSAHRHGMECYAVLKPFDMGLWGVLPPDAPQAWKRVERIHGWAYWTTDLIHRAPLLREQRFLEGLDPNDPRPVRTLRLIKDDDRAPAFAPQDIELYVSAENRNYRRYQGPLEINCRQEWIDDACYFPTPAGRRSGGAPRRCTVITLENLNVPEKFLLLRAGSSLSFGNRLFRLVTLLDARGVEIPFEVAFHPLERGGDALAAGAAFCNPMGLLPGRETDLAFLDGPTGMLAAARGTEAHLVGFPFIGHPEIRQGLFTMMDECLEAGVDGIDFRVGNHNRTFTWSAFGFQDPVRQAFREQFERDILRDPFRLEDLRRLRGEFYTQFLRSARRRLRERGVSMQLHVQPHFADPAGRLTNEIHWDWRTWIREGLADAVTLKMSEGLRPRADDQRAVLQAARAADIPVYACPYLNGTLKRQGRAAYYQTLLQSYRSEGMDGHILYENAALLQADAQGRMKNLAPDYFDAVHAVMS